MVSDEIILAAIGAATTVITALLAYLVQKLERVHRVVNSSATALALQVAADKSIALERAEQDKNLAVGVEKDKALAQAETEVRVQIAAKTPPPMVADVRIRNDRPNGGTA